MTPTSAKARVWLKLHNRLVFAFAWYERRSDGVGRDIMRVIGDASEQLSRNPEAYAPTGGRFCRVLLRRFPYALHFELLNDQHIYVLACLRHHRNPARWCGNCFPDKLIRVDQARAR